MNLSSLDRGWARQSRHFVLAVSFLFLGMGCSAEGDSPESKSQKITIDGSSTVFPITSEIAQEYQLLGTEKPEIQVNISGTGGGFRKFCAGETDINNASRPILKDEMAACKSAGVKYIELPIAYDALVVVVNPKNDWADDITLAELQKMWEPEAEGKVTTWQQIRSSWPDRPLKLYGPGRDSGTFDYFTEATVGETQSSRNDYTASEYDTLLVRGVMQDTEALGYFGYSYYEETSRQLKALAIDSGADAVLPSRDTVRNGTYQPLSRPLFIYVNAEAAKNKPEVRSFIEYYLNEGRQFVKVAGYVPLPDELYNLAVTHFENGKVGTVFEGKSQLNLKIEDLLQKEAKF